MNMEEHLKNDLFLTIVFLEKNYELYQNHLESLDIEPTEAEVMIENFKKACGYYEKEDSNK